MMFYTYFHTRNDTGAVFYIGKGKGKRAHSTGHNPHWKNIAAKHGHTVHLAMTNLTEQEAFEHEKFLIECFRGMGVPLTNCTDGGEGVSGHIHSPEALAKMGAAKKGNTIWLGRKHTAESREKVRAALKGHHVSDTTKTKISLVQIGGKRKESTKQKISAYQQANLESKRALARKLWQDKDYREKTLQGQKFAAKTHPPSQAINEARRSTMKQRWADPKFRASMMQARKTAPNVRQEIGVVTT